MTRPRAADDFAVIRTRLVELQRERDQAFRGADDAPKPSLITGRSTGAASARTRKSSGRFATASGDDVAFSR